MSYLNLENSHSRTIVIGDIHGCFDELSTLLNLIGFCSTDILITVGDFMDRGPKSWQTASFFKNTSNAFSVLGNHECRLSGVIQGTSEPAYSHIQTLSQMDTQHHAEWASYFDTLPAVIETDHVVVTHARIDPVKSIKKQNSHFTCAVGGKKAGFFFDENKIPDWFISGKDKFKGKPVCFGHVKYNSLVLVQNSLFALDTDAVKGGMLTAIIFPGADLIQVKCRDYDAQAHALWMESLAKTYDVSTMKICKVLKIISKNSNQLNGYEKIIMAKFSPALDKLNLISIFSRLKFQIIDRFGKMPPPGPERGKYFINLKSTLAIGRSGLLQIILSEKFNVLVLLKKFEGQTLNDLTRSLE